MATLTAVGLIAGSVAFGLFLIIFGVRGAVRLWRQERAD